MAAGSSRILRYLLFAFFVSRSTYGPQHDALTIEGRDGTILHLFILNTSATYTRNPNRRIPLERFDGGAYRR